MLRLAWNSQAYANVRGDMETSELLLQSAGLRFGPLGKRWIHLCVDMQRMFSESTPWRAVWMPRVLPAVVRLVERAPERTLFTRFLPPPTPSDAAGTWRRYYERWADMTLERIDPELIDVVPALKRFVPPARLFDKPVYSPWAGGRLHTILSSLSVDTLVVSGTETEVCVLATVLGAIDHGYRVIVATDAVCSSADPTHDAVLEIYHNRFSMQVETASVDEIVDASPP
jgi:nicotinamidase-related amidase